jgi:hypothetical protein
MKEPPAAVVRATFDERWVSKFCKDGGDNFFFLAKLDGN